VTKPTSRIGLSTASLMIASLLFQGGVAQAADRTVSTAALSPSQIVARGSVDAQGGCSWSGSDQFQSDHGQWVSFHIGQDCVARLGAAWTGGLADGPPAITDSVVAASGNVVSNAQSATTMSATTCQTGKEYVYTYGGGGPIWDKLTKIWSALTYCYNDSYVWGSSTAGSACAGQPEISWNWVVDACAFSSQYLTTNSTSVWSTLKGTYHCDPVTSFPCSILSGYHHHLYAKVLGLQSGHSTCTFWWDGSIVFGPNQDVISGCV
jgi:hypothetical protein